MPQAEPPKTLPSITRRLTQEQVQRYALASGDHNPLHLDPQFAATTPFGRPIAHGMLTMAFLAEMMAQAFGEAWLKGGKLRVRFKAPVYPGDQVFTWGELLRWEAGDGYTDLEYAVALKNQDQQAVLTGTAWVRVPLERV